jgi:O-antigen ligase/Tfp pilus assembly protein PilF
MNAAPTHASRQVVPHASVWRTQLARGCDLAVIATVTLLVVGAPMARGAEDPAALAMLEQFSFILIIIWAVKSALVRSHIAPPTTRLISLGIPLAALALYLGLQGVPLSPAVMKIISTGTYVLYSRVLGSAIPTAAHGAGAVAGAGLRPMARESISIAPELTCAAFLKLLAYCSVMLVVAGYPLEAAADGRQERRFAGALTVAILLSAVLVGLTGGCSLFAAYRSSAAAAALEMPRAHGTFHNPDHFGDYLMLTIPFAIAAVLAPEAFVRRQWREPFAVLAAVASVLGLVGLLTSLSRGAWLAALAALATLVLAISRHNGAEQPAADGRQNMRMRGAAGAGCALLLVALLVSGGRATERIGVRLHQTGNHDESMMERFAVWRDSLGIVHDFPLLGIGLGGWPEIFARYDRSPWDPEYFWRETHNDYLQLLEETGAIGFLLFLWVTLSQARALARARRTVSGRHLIVVAAAIAAAVGFATHELVDFSFQVPANAVLLMVMLGLAHRQSVGSGVQWWQPVRSGSRRLGVFATAAGAVVVALSLIVCAGRHDRLPYPYNLDAKMDAAQSLDAARAAARITVLIRDFPAHAAFHLDLGQYLLEQNQTAAARGELETAVWLEPANPEAHDNLARVLFEQGDRAGSRREITTSVRYSPRPSTHDYLNPSAIPILTAAELKAIDDGYHLALWNPDAILGLGYFYNRLARYQERGALYSRAAEREGAATARYDYLLKAGESYSLADDTANAAAVLAQAVTLDPTGPGPYRILAALYIKHHELARARAVIGAGIVAGTDAVALYLALAEAAAKAGDKAETIEALNRAMEQGPVGFDDNLQIGVMYLDCADFERAINPLKAATAADSRSADGFYYLALAEQNSYNFAAASSAFKHALELEPDRTDIQTGFAALQHEIDRNGIPPGRHDTAFYLNSKLYWNSSTTSADGLKP